jgi:hypothetical protein
MAFLFGISTQELAVLEDQFLDVIDFELHVSQHEYEEYANAISFQYF